MQSNLCTTQVIVSLLVSMLLLGHKVGALSEIVSLTRRRAELKVILTMLTSADTKTQLDARLVCNLENRLKRTSTLSNGQEQYPIASPKAVLRPFSIGTVHAPTLANNLNQSRSMDR